MAEKYTKEFKAWYRNIMIPHFNDTLLYAYHKEAAWKGWKAGRAKLNKSNVTGDSERSDRV